MRVAANIARAAGTRADVMQGVFHRGDDFGMLTHAKIIVRTPHGNRLWPVMSGKAPCVGISALVTQYVDEHAVATFGV